MTEPLTSTGRKQRKRIKQLKNCDPKEIIGSTVTVRGWVRTVRNQKTFTFLELNDGSTLSNLQIILDSDTPNYESIIAELSTGVALAIQGEIKESPGKGQNIEIQAKEILITGGADPESYPLQKKRHSFEFLRQIAHLRPRTNTIGALARVRSQMAFATHRFFQEQGFHYLHSPIITGSDCEGAGELFQVTSLPMNKIPTTKEDSIDYSQDFFEKPAFLTVSGQLEGEVYAQALSDVYTFGPTFRAENSNTSRHLAEFWMIEPEMAFADLADNQDNAEAFVQYVLKYTLEHCQEEMAFFNQFISKGILERIEKIVETPFERTTYTYAIRILERADKKFTFPVKWGIDLQSEHERYLAEEFFKKPVIITDYPKEIKAFYMRANDDEKTVAAMDVLVPGIGELIGGSQREERLDVLDAKLDALKICKKHLWWYRDLRRYGSCPHAGYGVGFERLLQLATGMENIRDVIPFPRTPGHLEF